jgi:hypothetical protein
MNKRVLQRAHELMAQSGPFALATVVRRGSPTSGQLGDNAVIPARVSLWAGWGELRSADRVTGSAESSASCRLRGCHLLFPQCFVLSELCERSQ